MRGARAKWLKKKAQEHPSEFKTGFYGRTFIRGGAVRTYKLLRRAWKAGIR